MIWKILITILLVLLNAFFVAAEFAIVKVRGSQIDLRVRSGHKSAKIARHLIDHLNEYLSATQLGITFASLGLGWIGEPVVSKIIIAFVSLLGINLDTTLIEKFSLPAAFITITVLHIVFGELAPKSIAIIKSEQTALFVSLPLRLFYFVFKPFIFVLNGFANLIVKMIGLNPIGGHIEFHSEDELRHILKESSKIGTIEKSEEKLIQNIFDFADRKVRQVMIPRNRIVGVDKNSTLMEILQKFNSEGYSRMPVFDTTIDDIVGILYAKDLLKIVNEMGMEQRFVLEKITRKPLFVHEDEKIETILRLMQKNKVHIAIVTDDFGGTAGLVSIEDILEEIVGEIQDEYDEEPPIVVQITDKDFEIIASANIDDVNDLLPIKLPKQEEYDTVGGFVYHNLGRIPKQGETIRIENLELVVVQTSERSIEKVRIRIV